MSLVWLRASLRVHRIRVTCVARLRVSARAPLYVYDSPDPIHALLHASKYVCSADDELWRPVESRRRCSLPACPVSLLVSLRFEIISPRGPVVREKNVSFYDLSRSALRATPPHCSTASSYEFLERSRRTRHAMRRKPLTTME